LLIVKGSSNSADEPLGHGTRKSEPDHLPESTLVEAPNRFGYVDLSPIKQPIRIVPDGGDDWMPTEASLLEIPPAMRLREWTTSRLPRIHAALERVLGDRPPRPTVPDVDSTSQHVDDGGGYTIHHFRFHNGADAVVPGCLVLPENVDGPVPLLVYCHYHGGEYETGKREIFDPGSGKWTWPAGLKGRIADHLAALGYAVLIIDHYGFGERQGKGPNGPDETGEAEIKALGEEHRRKGRTLRGMRLRDIQMALDWALKQPGIDANRIGALGMSMGSTDSRMLAAIEPRIAAVNTIAGMGEQHALIAAAIAPRPYLALNGTEDGCAMPVHVRAAESLIRPVYKLHRQEGNFQSLAFEGVGHEYNKDMFAETVRFFGALFKPSPNGSRRT
jgi:dienelactone hydrolase